MNTKSPQFRRLTAGQWLLLAIAILVIVFSRSLIVSDRDDRPGQSRPDQSPVTEASVEPENSSDLSRSASGGTANHERSAQSSDTQVTPSSVELEPKGLEPKETGPRLGALHPLGNDVFLSSAGLKYGPGSREGHRLKHVLLHAKDQPGRSGSHGVFDGGREGTLKAIDEAYRIAATPGPETQKKTEGRRTVYTVDLGRVIGYVGGQTGQRRRHPKVTHVRLVLEGVNVITAFPLDPPSRNR